MAGQDLGALLGILDRHRQALRDRQGLGLDLDVGGVLGDQGAGGGVALDVDRYLDGHLLAAANHDQVEVGQGSLDRVHGDGLGQRQLLGAVDVQAQHRVGAGVTHHRGEVVGIELEVLRGLAVAVEHGRDLAVAAGLARGALTRAGADLDVELVGGGAFGHVMLLPSLVSTQRRGPARVS